MGRTSLQLRFYLICSVTWVQATYLSMLSVVTEGPRIYSGDLHSCPDVGGAWPSHVIVCGLGGLT